MQRFKNTLSELTHYYGLDVRSLALMRVCLALILLVDIRIRFEDLRAFYADWGVMPRSFLIEEVVSPFKLSFHLMNGFGLFQGFLMALAFVIALALLMGYRTRLATALSWVFLCSLQARNPQILQAGDGLIRLTLFWSMFLPLGAAWSVDRALDSSGKEAPKKVFSGGSVALLAQFCMLYFFTAALKNGPQWTLEGTAVYYSLQLEKFQRPFGQFLLHFPALPQILTPLVLWFERLGPFLILMPLGIGVVRTIGVLLFVVLHIGMGSGLHLGPFPFIGATTALVFLPSEFWDRVLPRLRPRGAAGLRVYYDGDCGFCKKSALLIKTFFLASDTPVLPAQSVPEIEKEMRGHNSWVVRDAEKKSHYKFDAFLAIVSASPLGWPLARVLAWRPFHFFGTRIYEAIACRRALASHFLPLPSFRPLETALPRWASAVALFLVSSALVWNLSGLGFFKIPKPARIPVRLLCLDQRWGMFAPSPESDGGWHIFYARSRNGDEIDLLRGGRPLDMRKPADPASLYKNERWRKYLENISQPTNVEARPYLGHYLCLEWNRKQKDTARKIERVEIYWMKEPSPPPGSADPEPKKVLLWGEDCPNRTK